MKHCKAVGVPPYEKCLKCDVIDSVRTDCYSTGTCTLKLVEEQKRALEELENFIRGKE